LEKAAKFITAQKLTGVIENGRAPAADKRRKERRYSRIYLAVAIRADTFEMLYKSGAPWTKKPVKRGRPDRDPPRL